MLSNYIMNKELTPKQVLQELYKYFCISLQKEHKVKPEEITHINQMYKLMSKYIDEKEQK